MRTLIAILFAGGLAGAAWAQLPMHSPPLGSKAGVGAYVGPLDAISAGAKATVVACWAFRACAASNASGLSNAFQVGHTAGTAIDVTVLTNGNWDSSTANSNCGALGCNLYRAYDQSGNGYTLPASGQNSGASAIVFNCIGSVACDFQNGNDGFGKNASFAAVTDPLTFSNVMKRSSSNTGSPNSIGLANSGTFGCLLGGHLANGNGVYLYDGSSSLVATANDDQWHAVQGQLTAGTNTSHINVDGTETAGTLGHCVNTSNAVGVGSPAAAGGTDWGGDMVEAIIFSSALSSADRTSLCRNQQAYYGTGNFPATC